jgi:hypothetical protein
LRIDEVDLVEEDLVSEGHLVNGFVDDPFLTLSPAVVVSVESRILSPRHTDNDANKIQKQIPTVAPRSPSRVGGGESSA